MSDVELIQRNPSLEPVCGCLNRLRVALRSDNGMPGTHRITGAASIYIRRADPTGPAPPAVFASFCPFCGEAYQ